MKAIALTAWNRPEALRVLLESLQQVRRLEGWQLFIRVEPSPVRDALIQLIQEISLPCAVKIHCNDKRLGVRANPLACLQDAAKAGAEYFLLLEDDLELSADCLEFVELALEVTEWNSKYSCGNLHFSTCFNEAHLQSWNTNSEELPSTSLETWFLSSLGLFFTKTQFVKFIQKHWNDNPLQLRSFSGEQVSGWDCAIKQALLLRDKPCLQSLLPRVRHCGIDGVHSDAVLHQKSYAHAGLYTGTKQLTKLNRYSVDSINKQPPEGSEVWGALLRMGSQLWSMERTSLKRQQELARCSKQLAQLIERKPQGRHK